MKIYNTKCVNITDNREVNRNIDMDFEKSYLSLIVRNIRRLDNSSRDENGLYHLKSIKELKEYIAQCESEINKQYLIHNKKCAKAQDFKEHIKFINKTFKKDIYDMLKSIRQKFTEDKKDMESLNESIDNVLETIKDKKNIREYKIAK